MKSFIALALCASALLAPEEWAIARDSSRASSAGSSPWREPSVAELCSVLAEWESTWRLVDPGFRLDSLRWGVSTFRFQSGWPMEGWLVRRVRDPRTGLLFAPDGTRAVDPAFGRILGPQDDEFEADPMVQVYDLRERKRHLLTVGGIQGPFHVPAWLDRDFLLVAGAWESGGDSLQAICYGFDLQSRTYRIATASSGVTWTEYKIYVDSLSARIRRAHPDGIR